MYHIKVANREYAVKYQVLLTFFLPCLLPVALAKSPKNYEKDTIENFKVVV